LATGVIGSPLGFLSSLPLWMTRGEIYLRGELARLPYPAKAPSNFLQPYFRFAPVFETETAIGIS